MGLFDAFQPFECSFTEKYGDIAATFPFAMMVMEKELRNYHAGETHTAIQNLTPQAARNPVKALLLQLSAVFAPAKGPSYYTKLSGFGAFEADLRDQLARKGLISFSHQKLAWFSRNKQLHALAVCGRWFPRFARSVLARGIDATTTDHTLLAGLNQEIAANVEHVKHYIRRNDIRLFISDGDCMFFQRVIVQAANQMGIPYVVFSHGFITAPALLTIAPLYADMFVTWTEDQRRELSLAIGKESENKLRHFGFPKPPALQGESVGGRVLIVWHPFVEALGINIQELNIATTIIQRLVAVDLSPVLRLHPKDRSNVALINALQDRGIVTDHSRVGTAIASAQVVLGSLSSLLVEASSVGKPVFQLSNYPSIPDLPQVSVDDKALAETVRDACGKSLPPSPRFDLDAFCEAVLRLMEEKRMSVN